MGGKMKKKRKSKKRTSSKKVDWMPMPKKNKKGQMFLIGIMIAIMALLIFVSTLPAVKETINTVRGCSYMNCAGYVDTHANGAGCSGSNQTYYPSYETDTLGCTILDLAIPFLILGLLIAIIYKIMRGESLDQPQPAYPGY
jgi:hypothetical protein